MISGSCAKRGERCLVALGTAIALGLCALASPTAGLASRLPILKVKPDTLSSAGGEVAFVAPVVGGDATCTVAATPSYGGLPSPFSCGLATTWPYLSVPPNKTSATESYEYTVTMQQVLPSTTTTFKPFHITVEPAPATTYVALGDSYASGEGNPGKGPKPWMDRAGKPTEVLNHCNRSAVAYPMLVSKWFGSHSNLPAMSLRFLACSGATTEDVWNSGAYTEHGLHEGNHREWQQMLDTVDLEKARIVTVMVGGNDLDFADVLHNCVVGPPLHYCNKDSNDGWIADLEQNIATLEPILRETYKQVETLAPSAAVYVVGYPDLFPINASLAHQVACSTATLITEEGVQYLIENQDRLATAVQQAAEEAGAHFVNPNSQGPDGFEGHDVCALTPWFNGLVNSGQFHPNKAGQAALAKDVEAAITADSTVSGSGGSPAKGTWTAEPLEVPTNLLGSWGLSGVACPIAGDCVGVGNEAVSGQEAPVEPLIERWDGSSWTIEAAPLPVGHGNASLQAVSCSSATSCLAVGYAGTLPLAETWNGASWHLVPPQNYGADGSRLASVSCTSPNSCDAVGTYQDEHGWEHPLVEHWEGAAWTVQQVADPDPPGPNANNSELDGVSCPTAISCMAVGTTWSQAEDGYRSLTENTNGSVWYEQAFPDLPETFQDPLESVSCTASTNCVAVGAYSKKDEIESAGILAGHWTGTAWTPFLTSGGSESLRSIACTPTSWCLAVSQGEDMTETWTGSLWTENTPTPGLVNAVACVTEHECIAVGSEAYLYSG
jgi:lysophospholipase L1-like esterase